MNVGGGLRHSYQFISFLSLTTHLG